MLNYKEGPEKYNSLGAECVKKIITQVTEGDSLAGIIIKN